MSPIRGGILEAMGSKNGKRWGPPGDVCWFINSMNPIVVISVTSPGSSKFRKWEDVRSASTWTQTRIPRYFFSQKTALVHSCSLQQRTRQMKHEFNYIYIYWINQLTMSLNTFTLWIHHKSTINIHVGCPKNRPVSYLHVFFASRASALGSQAPSAGQTVSRGSNLSFQKPVKPGHEVILQCEAPVWYLS